MIFSFLQLNLSMKSFKSEASDLSKTTLAKQIYTKVGIYKNLTVSVKTIDFQKSSINLNRVKLMELKQVYIALEELILQIHFFYE